MVKLKKLLESLLNDEEEYYDGEYVAPQSVNWAEESQSDLTRGLDEDGIRRLINATIKSACTGNELSTSSLTSELHKFNDADLRVIYHAMFGTKLRSKATKDQLLPRLLPALERLYSNVLLPTMQMTSKPIEKHVDKPIDPREQRLHDLSAKFPEVRKALRDYRSGNISNVEFDSIIAKHDNT